MPNNVIKYPKKVHGYKIIFLKTINCVRLNKNKLIKIITTAQLGEEAILMV